MRDHGYESFCPQCGHEQFGDIDTEGGWTCTVCRYLVTAEELGRLPG